MPELYFVLKTFILSLVIALCLQIKVSNRTLESYANEWVQRSNVGEYLTMVAGGASVVIRTSGKAVSDYVSETFGHETTGEETIKSGRMQFELKRSTSVQELEKLKKKQKEELENRAKGAMEEMEKAATDTMKESLPSYY